MYDRAGDCSGMPGQLAQHGPCVRQPGLASPGQPSPAPASLAGAGLEAESPWAFSCMHMLLVVRPLGVAT